MSRTCPAHPRGCLCEHNALPCRRERSRQVFLTGKGISDKDNRYVRACSDAGVEQYIESFAYALPRLPTRAPSELLNRLYH